MVGGGKKVGVPGSELMDAFEEDELKLMPWDANALGRLPGKGPIGPGELMPAARPRDPGTVMGKHARPVDPGEVMRSRPNQFVIRLAAQVAAGG